MRDGVYHSILGALWILFIILIIFGIALGSQYVESKQSDYEKCVDPCVGISQGVSSEELACYDRCLKYLDEEVGE